jgi:hypothetical protein
MSVEVRIPGLAWEDMAGGQAGQEAMFGRAPEECEDPGVVRAFATAERVQVGRGSVYVVTLHDADDADTLLVQAEALEHGARDSEERTLARSLVKAQARLAAAKRNLEAELQA